MAGLLWIARPTLRLPDLLDEEDSCPTNERKRRIRELMGDVASARAEDLDLQKKFEKDAAELLKFCSADEEKKQWQPHPLGDSSLDDEGMRLKLQLDHSRFQLAEARNQLHTLKKDLAAYEKLLRQELGDVDLHQVLTSPRWRGRAQEIKRLKEEIAGMERKAYGQKYMEDPLCFPKYNPRFPRVDDFIPKSQLQFLKNEARRKQEMADKDEKQINDLIEEYGSVSLMYKAALTHNKMLAEEFRSIKGQNYEDKARDDRELVKNLVAHQMQMRHMLDREAHLASLLKKREDKEGDEEPEDELDASRYKALWEASECEMQSFQEMVGSLTSRLEDIVREAEEAEKHCMENESRYAELQQQIEEQKATAKTAAKTKDAKPKSQAGKPQPLGKSLSLGDQLAAVRAENEFLKNFLKKAIQAKEQDLKLYQHTMSSIREQYLQTLKELQSGQVAPKSQAAA
ncbi:uncharacterized protein LOC129228519 [Uloborus diversus]|uniref:uncharacterized protein LOC129228519 n=1 Tax=Uloborus diversus TaxID=327109 RepID=UPI0024095393|nr:uncharacterized protein LOC129228519 [Uloborus diversus]